MTTQLKSNSEIRLFKQCRRAWWLSYFRQLRKIRRTLVGPAPLGTRCHKALEAYYKNPGAQGRMDANTVLKELMDAEVLANPGAADEIAKEAEYARIIIDGYFEWLEATGADRDLEVIEAEHKLITRSPVDGVELIAKLDLTVRQISTGRTGHLDHKTVQSIEQTVKILHLDEQHRQYSLMRKVANPDSQTVNLSVHNMLRKVKRSARAKPPFYERYEVYISDGELRNFWQRLYGEISDILRAEQQLRDGGDPLAIAYPTPTRDCTWRCEFYDVCPLFDDPNADPEHLVGTLYEVGDPLARYEEDILDSGGEAL